MIGRILIMILALEAIWSSTFFRVYSSVGEFYPLEKDNYWVYQDQIEIQDLQGDFEVYNKYIGKKVTAKRIKQLRTLKVLSTETRGDFKIVKMQEEGTPEGIITFFYVVDNKNRRIYSYSNEEIRTILSNDKDITIRGSPEYIFPLQVGLKWGEPESMKRKDNMYVFFVEKIEDVTVPAGTFKNCFKIVYYTLPDETIQWFCPNVGVIRFECRHHGTINNLVSELKQLHINEIDSSNLSKKELDIIPEVSGSEFEYMNKVIINSSLWKLFTKREKKAYILGYANGLVNAAIYYLPTRKKREELIGTIPNLAGDISVDELIEKIDEFYSDERNYNIPISYVILIIRNQLIGVDEEIINEYIEYLRAIF